MCCGIVLPSCPLTNPDLLRVRMSVQLLPVAATDLEKIAALARIVWQSTYPGIITQAQIDYMLEQRYNAPLLLE